MGTIVFKLSLSPIRVRYVEHWALIYLKVHWFRWNFAHSENGLWVCVNNDMAQKLCKKSAFMRCTVAVSATENYAQLPTRLFLFYFSRIVRILLKNWVIWHLERITLTISIERSINFSSGTLPYFFHTQLLSLHIWCSTQPRRFKHPSISFAGIIFSSFSSCFSDQINHCAHFCFR